MLMIRRVGNEQRLGWHPERAKLRSPRSTRPLRRTARCGVVAGPWRCPRRKQRRQDPPGPSAAPITSVPLQIPQLARSFGFLPTWFLQDRSKLLHRRRVSVVNSRCTRLDDLRNLGQPHLSPDPKDNDFTELQRELPKRFLGRLRIDHRIRARFEPFAPRRGGGSFTAAAPERRSRMINRRVADGPVHPGDRIVRRAALRQQGHQRFLNNILGGGAVEPLAGVERQPVRPIGYQSRQPVQVAHSSEYMTSQGILFSPLFREIEVPPRGCDEIRRCRYDLDADSRQHSFAGGTDREKETRTRHHDDSFGGGMRGGRNGQRQRR